MTIDTVQHFEGGRTQVHSALLVGILLISAAISVAPVVHAQTGVSDERVSLPEGPGSLEGVGENVEMNPNMGNMSYGVPINVPAGFKGMTPALGLSYSSGSGSGVVGMGWSMQIPNIERMTYRGLPRYDVSDDFSADGGQQLVRLPESEPPTYRARFEGGFVRYRWHEAGSLGQEGYWTAEYPDGRVGYFGADAQGNEVTEARVSGDVGTFRYMLVEMLDVYGHSMRYTYRKSGTVSLIEEIGYVYNGGDTPRYRVTFGYEARMDGSGAANLSDAKPGFDELLTERLSDISVYSSANRLRRYALTYEPYVESGGFTRLKKVEMEGLEGDIFPAKFSFAYSQALGGVCEGEGCEQPFMVDMGRLGVSLDSGRATLFDINGDALPDMLHTPTDGPHQFFLNVPSADGSSSFQTPPVISTLGGPEMALGGAFSQVLDTNGDGFTDLLNVSTGQVLLNNGSGDWSQFQTVGESASLRNALESDYDFESNGLRSLRFLDLDNDKRIDLLQATQSETRVWRNMGVEGFITDPAVQQLGAGFDVGRMELADMNGDGLLDVVQLQQSQVRYRLNYGRGRWGDWRSISDVPYEEVELQQVNLEDLNGDALADIVVVTGDRIKYALNRNASAFFGLTTLTSREVSGSIPERTGSVSVLYADMNGNGSSDIVWVSGDGQVQYLELFPVRPNLLSRIENGLGQVTEISYTTSVQQMALDGGLGAWSSKLPHPMLVVERTDTFDLLTNIHEETSYRYHEPFYDGVEKQFRGFKRVEATLTGDDSHEPGLTVTEYEVGDTDPYRHALMLKREVYSDGRPLAVDEMRYEDCPVEGIPGPEALELLGQLPIRHICSTVSLQVIQEGAPVSEHVTTETRQEYDGYGNVIKTSSLGVTDIGGGGCAPCDRDAELFGRPCGAQCVGDEEFSETAFVSPENTSGRWILGAPYRTIIYGQAGSDLVKESLSYYDGEPLTGLPLGQLQRGDVSRATHNVEVGSDDIINTARYRYDSHGNVLETLDPNATSSSVGHRRSYTYDADNLRVIGVDVPLEDSEGDTYTLRREYRYEPIFDKVSEATDWMIVRNGEVLSSRRASFFTYDQFARPVSRVLPGGDTLQSASEVYTYELGNPTSRVIAQKRSQSGEALDLESLQCMDGRGRVYQTRSRLESGKYLVTGFTRFNVRGEAREVFQPYTSDSRECDTTPPGDVLSVRTRHDATYRPIEVISPDATIYGTASVQRTEYAPLKVAYLDPEDNDPNSPHSQTPTIQHMDGLGRLVAVERQLESGQPVMARLRYDPLGRLVHVLDPMDNVKVQTFDLLDRIVQVDDPNSAEPSRTRYDAASNVVEMIDGRGVVTRSEYDGLNRLVARWDEAAPTETRISWTHDQSATCPANQCTHTEGRLVEARYPTGVDRFGYDVRGRAVSSVRVIEGYPLSTEYVWDNADRLLNTVYPDGQVLEHQYDDASRLIGVKDVVSMIRYDNRGLMENIDCADGSSTTMTHDALMRLETNTTADVTGVLIQGFGYTRDRVGNILAVEDTSATPEIWGVGASYQYDAWYRTVSAELSAFGQAPGEVLSYQYDVLDNIRSITSSLGDTSPAHRGTYEYEGFAPNAVTDLKNNTYDYDADGRVQAQGGTTLQWDFIGRLTESTGGNVPARFEYGAGQARLIKHEGASRTVYVGDSFELRDGISTLYARVGGQRVARLESDALAADIFTDLAPVADDGATLQPQPDGQITAADAWMSQAHNIGIITTVPQGTEPTSPEQLLASSTRRLLLENGEPKVFLHHDHLGSITLATAGGQTVGRRSFYPTGLERQTLGYVDAYGFTGQELDESTGLIHFKYRYLDPRSGRWTAPDPLFAQLSVESMGRVAEALGAYGYVAGNFVNAFDPTGLLGKKTIKKSYKATRSKAKKVKGKASKYTARQLQKHVKGKRTQNLARGAIVLGQKADNAYVSVAKTVGNHRKVTAALGYAHGGFQIAKGSAALIMQNPAGGAGIYSGAQKIRAVHKAKSAEELTNAAVPLAKTVKRVGGLGAGVKKHVGTEIQSLLSDFD